MIENMNEMPLIPPIPEAAPFYSAETDPQGSYTGVPEEPDELPVQDADDL